MALLAAFAGAMTALPAADHPVADLSWERARENFYAAARDGLDGDVTWTTADGRTTNDLDRCLDDVLGTALDGLTRCGLARKRATAPVESVRDRRRRTPATGKRSLFVTRLNGDRSLAEAIHETQRAYPANQRETFVDGSVADWPVPF